MSLQLIREGLAALPVAAAVPRGGGGGGAESGTAGCTGGRPFFQQHLRAAGGRLQTPSPGSTGPHFLRAHGALPSGSLAIIAPAFNSRSWQTVNALKAGCVTLLFLHVKRLALETLSLN